MIFVPDGWSQEFLQHHFLAQRVCGREQPLAELGDRPAALRVVRHRMHPLQVVDRVRPARRHRDAMVKLRLGDRQPGQCAAPALPPPQREKLPPSRARLPSRAPLE